MTMRLLAKTPTSGPGAHALYIYLLQVNIVSLGNWSGAGPGHGCVNVWRKSTSCSSATPEPWFLQVLELDMALTEVREEAELLRLRLHVARAERDAARGAGGHPGAVPAAPPPSHIGHVSLPLSTTKLVLSHPLVDLSYNCDMFADTSVQGLALPNTAADRALQLPEWVEADREPPMLCHTTHNLLAIRRSSQADSEVATLMRELEGLGALETTLPADSPPACVATAAAAPTAGSPVAGGHAAHSPTLSLPAASAWVPVGSRSANTSPAAGAAAAAAALHVSPLSASVPSPLAAASAAASPASHNCFRPAAEGSCSPDASVGDSAAAPPCAPVGIRSSHVGPVVSMRSPPSPAVSEISLAAATPLHSPAAEPAATASDGSGDDDAACEHAQPAGVADGSAGHEQSAGGADESGDSGSDSDSDAETDAQDGTWLPEFATPAQRRPTRRVRLKVSITCHHVAHYRQTRHVLRASEQGI